MWAIPTGTSSDFLKKKKKPGKESQYMVSHPELGSDPPIGSDRESGCDKLFVATLKYLSRLTCLGWSHVSSIFCRDIKLLCRDRNLSLNNFYCRDIDLCLVFFIVSQHKFLVILLNFCRNSSRLCHNKVHFNLMLCLSRLKNSLL